MTQKIQKLKGIPVMGEGPEVDEPANVLAPTTKTWPNKLVGSDWV